MASRLKDNEKVAQVAAALRTHGRSLRAFVEARVPASEVDDVLQTAALRAIERADSLHESSKVRAWLYQVHRNAATDVMRRRATFGRYISTQETLPEIPVKAEEEERCRCSIQLALGLSENYASILSLVDLRELRLTEAAKHLGISVNNAAVRLHRARQALRARLLEHCGVKAAGDCATCDCVDDSCSDDSCSAA